MKKIILFLAIIFSLPLHAVTFSDLNGSNGDLNKSIANKMGISIVRLDIGWNHVEKSKGKYDWKNYDKKISAIQSKRLEVLPVLAYTPDWNKKYPNKIGSPPIDNEAWVEFVKAAVSRYTRPPFNVKFFQIWNEPTKKAKYWIGSNAEFINNIYIPAAKVIRKHNAYVVFGGWPASNSIKELDDVMFKLGAIRYTDYLDFHYGNEGPYNHLYKKYLSNGLVKGIWQTELGYRTEKEGLLKIYLTIMKWALNHQWKHKDQYKLFWYPGWGSREKQLRGLTTTLQTRSVIPTSNGEQLMLLNTLYGNNDISPVKLSTSSKTAFAVLVGERKVVIADIFKKNKKRPKSNTYQIRLDYKPNNVYLVDALGMKKRIDYDYFNGVLKINQYLPEVDSENSDILFTVIE